MPRCLLDHLMEAAMPRSASETKHLNVGCGIGYLHNGFSSASHVHWYIVSIILAIVTSGAGNFIIDRLETKRSKYTRLLRYPAISPMSHLQASPGSDPAPTASSKYNATDWSSVRAAESDSDRPSSDWYRSRLPASFQHRNHGQ